MANGQRAETIAAQQAARSMTIAEMRRLHAREWHIEFGRALQAQSPTRTWPQQRSAASSAAVTELRKQFPADWLRVHDAAMATAKGERGWTPMPRGLEHNPAYRVVCPHCNAAVKQRCRRPNGVYRGVHKARYRRERTAA